jgi:hypothetical protein
VEGTLSLFDWRPQPAGTTEATGAPAAELGSSQPRIIIFDCETTGIDFTRDQVI